MAAWSCEHLIKDVLLGMAVLDISNLVATKRSKRSDTEKKEEGNGEDSLEVWVDLYRLKIKGPCTCDDHSSQSGLTAESEDIPDCLPETRKREYSLSKIPRYIGHNIKAKAADTVDTVKKALPGTNADFEKHGCTKCKNVKAVPAGRVLLGLSLVLLSADGA